MKVQIVSDIHLELDDTNFELEPISDYLFLAGDIGILHIEKYKQFLKYVSNNWKLIFYVLGNHEYYNHKKHINKRNSEYKEYISSNHNNIIILDRDIYKLDNLKLC